MEKSFLFCAVIVTFACAVFGAATEGESVQANSERFRRIEETLKKLETENRNLHTVVEKQKNEISILVQEQKVQQQEINELKHAFPWMTTRRETVDGKPETSQQPLFTTRNATKEDFIPLDKSEKGYKDGGRRDKDSRLLVSDTHSPTDTNDVAFYAYLSQTEMFIQHQTVIFDHVETNIGQAYNQHSGVFTVPISGIYIFSYTVFPAFPNSVASVELIVNSISRGAIYVDSSPSDVDFTGCTGFAVLALKLGDVCFVRLHPTYADTALSSGSAMRSSFSGVKM